MTEELFRPIEESAIRYSRKDRPKKGSLKNQRVPILGMEQRQILESWWTTSVSEAFQKDLVAWMDAGDVPSADRDTFQMSRAQTREAVLEALASSNGLPFTVENITSRALNNSIILEEYHGFQRTVTRRYLVEEFIEILQEARGVSDERKQSLVRIVSPRFPGFTQL